MKSTKKVVLIFASVGMLSGGLLGAFEEHKEDPHFVWFAGDEVAVEEDGIYADSKRGMLKLNVVEYDRGNNRYKVLCRCLKIRDLDMDEALSIPPEK